MKKENALTAAARVIQGKVVTRVSAEFMERGRKKVVIKNMHDVLGEIVCDDDEVFRAVQELVVTAIGGRGDRRSTGPGGQ